MKKTRANLLLIVFLAGLGLIACSSVVTPESATTPTVQLAATASATTAPASATPTVAPTQTPAPSATPTVAPTHTPAPSATPTVAPTHTPAPTVTPSAEATPTALALQGPAIAYHGISFNVDPDLGHRVYARDEQMYGAEFNYVRFSLAPDGWCREAGCVEVYPVGPYEEAFPGRSLPPLGAATVLRAQDQTLDFQNGNGARSVRMRGQDVFFANNEALVYDFQGYTDDGQYYVSIIIPIDAPILLSSADPDENTNAAAIPIPTELPSDYGQLADTMREYNQKVEQLLDQLTPADFTPSLSALDALVASLTIQKPPDEEAWPPTTETIGPFQLVTGLPVELTGDVIDLRVYSPRSAAERETADDRLWVATTNSYGVWQDGRWQTTPTDFRIQNMLPAQGGTVWLASRREVFIFDGVRWTILTPPDMDMTAPLDPDFFTPYVLERVGEQVWVGRCDWGGPGPMGGGGARWYDGTSWQGADSPVAAGCVTAIRADDQGRVWVAANADLWRYDPAADVWDRFAPPEPPEDYRFGYISDLTFDPAGGAWPLYGVCGGASCGQIEMRYRLDDGAWVLVREEIIFPQRLVFDGTGVPWLFFLDGAVYRFRGDPAADTLVADFIVDAVTTDAAGRIWVAGGPVMGETAVWLLEPDTAAGEAAECPSGGGSVVTLTTDAPGETIADKFEPQMLVYLNTGGEVQALEAMLNDLTLDEWQASSSVHHVDVTGDGTNDVVVNLLFYVPGQFADGAIFVYRCQAGEYVGGAVANIGGQVFAGSDPDPAIRAIQDMNGDGQAEIVFSYITVIGTHANFSREFRIIQWDGGEFVDLIQSGRDRPYAAEVLNGDGVIHDDDGDGIVELELTHGVGRGPEASALDREHTDVWAWDGRAFTLSHTKDAPPVFRVHAVWDGDAATLRGDYDDALALYQQAIFDEGLLGWSADHVHYDATSTDPDERPRLSAYSRYRIMLLHIARDYLPEAQIVYDTLQEQFPQGVVGYAYAALATAFWDEYDSGGDIEAACAKAIDYAAAHTAEILTPLGSGFYGFGQRDYAAEDVCPFK